MYAHCGFTVFSQNGAYPRRQREEPQLLVSEYNAVECREQDDPYVEKGVATFGGDLGTKKSQSFFWESIDEKTLQRKKSATTSLKRIFRKLM